MRQITFREIHDKLANLLEEVTPYAPSGSLLEMGRLKNKIAEAIRYQESLITNYKEAPVLCIDFDGVIHSYKSGWVDAGVIPDEPLPGAFPFIYKAVKTFQVQIFSARCNSQDGIIAMNEWFNKHGMPPHILSQLIFRPGKPSWFLHIDDRAIKFDGHWEKLEVEILKQFKPWYYGRSEWKR